MTLEPSKHFTDIQIKILEGSAENAALSALLDRSFPVPQGAHFYDDFPIWNAELTKGIATSLLRLGGFSGNQLVAFAGVRIAKMKTPNGLLTLALIGGVCTHPEWRGKQIASTVVTAAAQWASQQNAALIALWGSEHDLYRRLGFELCGSQVRVPLSNLKQVSTTEPVQKGFTDGIFSALQNRSSGLTLSPQDLSWIKAHKNVEWFWTGTSKTPSAYAALGKGIDLTDLIHEWGGTPPALLRLLGSVYERNRNASLLAHPLQLKELGISFDPSATEFLCMVRVLDPSAILRVYRSGVAHSVIPKQNGFAISVKNSPSVQFTFQESARLFFGPGQFDSPFGEVFPIPLWLWGLDGA